MKCDAFTSTASPGLTSDFNSTSAASTVEVWRSLPCDEKAVIGRHVLHSSDAHYLGDIQEREHALKLKSASVEELLAWMRSEKPAD